LQYIFHVKKRGSAKIIQEKTQRTEYAMEIVIDSLVSAKFFAALKRAGRRSTSAIFTTD
jgi:hypothetical protein